MLKCVLPLAKVQPHLVHHCAEVVQDVVSIRWTTLLLPRLWTHFGVGRSRSSAHADGFRKFATWCCRARVSGRGACRGSGSESASFFLFLSGG